ncbi:MAG: SMP-30/gluconolactonase/LRE family protein [Polaromonas sp.]|nr:SMP-30/gluconolactonase/LRE family protein [Polaromonas sp.]
MNTNGCVWTALQDGWSVLRFSPDGNQDRVIGLPVPCPSDVSLGGESLDVFEASGTLYLPKLSRKVKIGFLLTAFTDIQK